MLERDKHARKLDLKWGCSAVPESFRGPSCLDEDFTFPASPVPICSSPLNDTI